MEEDQFQKSVVPKQWRDKKRTLIVGSRGITDRHRHLMMDIFTLLPHSKKESKIEKKETSAQINELCSIHTCQNLLYFETRKKKNLYLWAGNAASGPSVKFQIDNIHTSHELKLTGNCIKGSRPILSFDAQFDQEVHWQLIKEVITEAFSVPQYHPKSKPFVDHILSFTICDNRIWFRNYQIFKEYESKQHIKTELVEIGPRFVMNPMYILDGCLNGLVLYQNQFYESPTQKKIDEKRKNVQILEKKNKKKLKKENYIKSLQVPKDNVDDMFDEENFDDYDDESQE